MTSLPHFVVTKLLGAHYQRQVDDRAWPPVKATNFLNLALVNEQTAWRTTVQTSVDDIIGDKKTVAYKNIFEIIENMKFNLILLEGRPGSGKTTLMNKISCDWAKQKILASKILVFAQFRRMNDEPCNSLDKLLKVACPSLPEKYVQELVAITEISQGENVVFAFDGLDEYKRIDEKHNLIRYLLNGTMLPKALVVVTSRPSCCAEFRQYAGRRIEVVGFLTPQVIQYVHHYFDNDKERAQELEEHLIQHPNLMNMAYLPLHCAMLAFLYEEDTALPETETEFYKFFTISTLLRSMRKRQDEIIRLTSYDELPENDKRIFHKVCKLAFSATVESKQVFNLDDVKLILTDVSFTSDVDSLGLVVIDRYFMRYGRDETYTFLHLTFQEYLAAVHIARLSGFQRNDIIDAYQDKKHLSIVWQFLCGTLDFRSACAMDTFFKVMTSNKSILFQLRCCYESQHPLVCTHVINAFGGKVELKDRQLTPRDCLAIGYTITKSNHQNVELHLIHTGIGANEFQVLGAALKDCENLKTFR